MTSTQKRLADSLRRVCEDRGIRLKASHAHELVAAFFGYRSKAALDADTAFPAALEEAWICLSNINLMNERRKSLQDLPSGLLDSEALAHKIGECLDEDEDFHARIYDKDNLKELEEFILEEYLPSHTSQLHDELSGIMAETNACFDEPDAYHSIKITSQEELVFLVDVTINGSPIEDRPFCGDQIEAQISLTSPLLAGHCLYGEPEFEAGGKVNDDWIDPD